MPLVRIDLNKDAPAERVRIVSQAVYGAMIEIANVPINDKFQIVTRHSADEIIYPEEGYLGVQYSPDLIIIQVTWVGGRSTDVKKQFYRRIADEIHAKAGVTVAFKGRRTFMRQGRPPGYRRSGFKALQPNGDAVHSDETAR